VPILCSNLSFRLTFKNAYNPTDLYDTFILIPLFFHFEPVRVIARVSGDGLVVPSWLAVCWMEQGSGFESRRRLLFFGISPWGEISLEGFIYLFI
jgi:hypothetical protein